MLRARAGLSASRSLVPVIARDPARACVACSSRDPLEDGRRAPARRRPARRSGRRCARSVFASTIAMFEITVRKNGHRLVHRAQQRPRAGRRRRPTARTRVPAPYQPGSMIRRLAPREHPRDRPQVLDPVGGGARRRAAADVQLGDLGDRRRRAEEVDEAGRAVDQVAVRVEGGRRTAPPSRRGSVAASRRVRRRQRRNDASSVAATIVSRLRRARCGLGELGGDDLALLGDPQRAVDRSRRLGEDRVVARAAAAPDGAAATVEQAQAHAVPRGDVDQVAPGPGTAPSWR